MMGLGCLIGIFRSVASLVLGIVIFLGFFTYLMIANVRDNFLDAEFYTLALSENDVYNRIYNDVLLDPEFENTTQNLLGDVDVASQKDIVSVVKDIITPEYLQEQVESALEGAIDYLNSETDEPVVVIDLGPPLDNVKPALFNYMDRRLDAIEEVSIDPPTILQLEADLKAMFETLEQGEIPTTMPKIDDPEALVNHYVDSTIQGLKEVEVETKEEFEQELEKVMEGLAKGQIPTTIPSIKSIPVSLRQSTFDEALAALKNDPNIPAEALVGLEAQAPIIKQQLEQDSIKGALERASRPLTGPVVEQFIDDAYDMAVKELRAANFPTAALDGLDERADEVKKLIGEGSIKEALKIGARGLAGPLIDEALDELRAELDTRERLDLIDIAAENNDQTKKEFLEDVDFVRNIIERTDLGVFVAMLAIVGGSIAMGIVHFPHMASGLRFPGMTLFFSGLIFLAIGLVFNSQVKDLFNDLLDRGAIDSPIPSEMFNIITDVLTSMASDVASGFVSPSIVMMVAGGVMVILSIIVRTLHIPFLSR